MSQNGRNYSNSEGFPPFTLANQLHHMEEMKMREKTNIRVRVPQVRSVEDAIRLYYEKNELSSSDIKMLFDVHSSATIAKLKNLAREKMAAENIPVWDSRNVNTAKAYECWGLQIENLEHRLKKLKELQSMTA